MKTGIQLITTQRKMVEMRDDEKLAWDAVFFATPQVVKSSRERVKQLVKAGALIAAEIDRLQNVKK